MTIVFYPTDFTLMELQCALRFIQRIHVSEKSNALDSTSGIEPQSCHRPTSQSGIADIVSSNVNKRRSPNSLPLHDSFLLHTTLANIQFQLLLTGKPAISRYYTNSTSSTDLLYKHTHVLATANLDPMEESRSPVSAIAPLPERAQDQLPVTDSPAT